VLDFLPALYEQIVSFLHKYIRICPFDSVQILSLESVELMTTLPVKYAHALANLTGAPTTKLLQSAFASLHLNQHPEASHLHVEVADLSLEKLKEYEGTFASGDGMTTQVSLIDGKLQLEAPGITPEVLEPIGDDEFFITLREIPSTMRFVRDEENNIRGIDFVLRQMPKVGEGSKEK
jgi:hypothetical protein